MIYMVINMEFTFLTKDQVIGEKQLDIFKKYGIESAITDFTSLLGGEYAWEKEQYTIEKEKSGNWWTKSKDQYNNYGFVLCDDEDNEYNVTPPNQYGIGSRPVTYFSSIFPFCSNERIGINGLKEVEYGEYPQTLASKKTSDMLEAIYQIDQTTQTNLFKKTGKVYTTDVDGTMPRDNRYEIIKEYPEYEYGEKKYIRFVSYNWYHAFRYEDEKGFFSDGRDLKANEAYWIEVEPIKWLIDEKEDLAVSKKVLFAGVPLDRNKHFEGTFEESNIKNFMDTYFSKEIEPSITYTQPLEMKEEPKEPIRKQNPYDFNFNEVSEEDIIKGALESGVSVFLHGRSSEGKSARVKQFDPDCEIIYLRNATPDSLNGKSVYNSETGEMIDVPPTWYKKIKKKCEEEPDKLHIVFFDEITNALPSIQGMAFNIVLDGEVNGIWKLPENARIVAAGNDLNDSLAANTMAEPLFNRFAHVYINTTVDSWLKWASTPNEEYERIDYKKKEPQAKIHPAIYAYISYKSFLGKDVLRTPYNGEKPNADPRKWEMASKVLYATKSPEMLRALIDEELTYDFCAFCRQQVISIEDVIKGNYTERDLDMNPAEKYATAVGLSAVDEQNFETIRTFISKLGPEIRATFDTLWTHGDEKRLEKIAELKMAEFTEGGMKK